MTRRDFDQQGTARGSGVRCMRRRTLSTGGPARHDRAALTWAAGRFPRRAGQPRSVPGSDRSARLSVNHKRGWDKGQGVRA